MCLTFSYTFTIFESLGKSSFKSLSWKEGDLTLTILKIIFKLSLILISLCPESAKPIFLPFKELPLIPCAISLRQFTPAMILAIPNPTLISGPRPLKFNNTIVIIFNIMLKTTNICISIWICVCAFSMFFIIAKLTQVMISVWVSYLRAGWMKLPIQEVTSVFECLRSWFLSLGQDAESIEQSIREFPLICRKFSFQIPRPLKFIFLKIPFIKPSIPKPQNPFANFAHIFKCPNINPPITSIGKFSIYEMSISKKSLHYVCAISEVALSMIHLFVDLAHVFVAVVVGDLGLVAIAIMESSSQYILISIVNFPFALLNPLSIEFPFVKRSIIIFELLRGLTHTYFISNIYKANNISNYQGLMWAYHYRFEERKSAPEINMFDIVDMSCFES